MHSGDGTSGNAGGRRKLTVNEQIIQALQRFGYPIAQGFYEGKQKEYITFDLPDDRGTCYADDGPGDTIVDVKIHLTVPLEKDYLTTKKEIRKALYQAGFAYPDVTVLTEPDGRNRRIIFETQIDNYDELE